MKRICTCTGIVTATSTLLLSSAPYVLANEPKGGSPDYSGISSIYYILIGLILAYGVYDSFFKKL